MGGQNTSYPAIRAFNNILRLFQHHRRSALGTLYIYLKTRASHRSHYRNLSLTNFLHHIWGKTFLISFLSAFPLLYRIWGRIWHSVTDSFHSYGIVPIPLSDVHNTDRTLHLPARSACNRGTAGSLQPREHCCCLIYYQTYLQSWMAS